MYASYTKDLVEAEVSLDYNVITPEREKEFEKREKEEMKKVEKQIRKEANEIEDIYANASLTPAQKAKQTRDRIFKSVEGLHRVQKALGKGAGDVLQQR